MRGNKHDHVMREGVENNMEKSVGVVIQYGGGE